MPNNWVSLKDNILIDNILKGTSTSPNWTDVTIERTQNTVGGCQQKVPKSMCLLNSSSLCNSATTGLCPNSQTVKFYTHCVMNIPSHTLIYTIK